MFTSVVRAFQAFDGYFTQFMQIHEKHSHRILQEHKNVTRKIWSLQTKWDYTVPEQQQQQTSKQRKYD